MALTVSFLAGSDTVRNSRWLHILLTDCNISDRIVDALHVSGSGPLSAGSKTGAGRTRYCNRKRSTTHVR